MQGTSHGRNTTECKSARPTYFSVSYLQWMEPDQRLSPLNAMNMKINTFDNLLSDPSVPPRPHVRHGHRYGIESGINPSAAFDLSPLEAIDAQAGVKEGLFYSRKTLKQRLRVPARAQVQQKSAQPSRKLKIKVDGKERDDDEDELFAPVTDTLDLLRDGAGRDRQDEVEALLARYFEPLQRYHVLYEALGKLEQSPLGNGKDLVVKNALNEMMSNLMERYPHELRRALQETDDMVNALEAMAGEERIGSGGPSTRELRFLIGAKSKGNFDAPLTPLTMLKALIKNFGADNCVPALTSLRSRMMIGF
jgi:hypothetical protein